MPAASRPATSPWTKPSAGTRRTRWSSASARIRPCCRTPIRPGSDFEKIKWTPGIYDSVSLIFCDNPLIETVQVAPRIAAGEIVVQTRSKNRGAAAVDRFAGAHGQDLERRRAGGRLRAGNRFARSRRGEGRHADDHDSRRPPVVAGGSVPVRGRIQHRRRLASRRASACASSASTPPRSAPT